jgi:hypothetical protein
MPAFPTWFPRGCPPPGAENAEGVVYRIVRNGPLTEDDFKSYHELGQGLAINACRRCGVSVFASLARARHRLELSPRLGTAIARGVLDASAGKAKLTDWRSGHIEWWAYAAVTRHSYFEEPVP